MNKIYRTLTTCTFKGFLFFEETSLDKQHNCLQLFYDPNSYLPPKNPILFFFFFFIAGDILLSFLQHAT